MSTRPSCGCRSGPADVSTVRNAVALLTRFPTASIGTDAPGAAAFGLVGALVGAAGAVPLAILAGPLGEPWLGAIAGVAVMAVVTGALHLDGLADTADALVARDPAAAERARKDPTLGVGGVLAVVVVVAADIAALVSLTASLDAARSALALVAVSAVSRIVPVVATLIVTPTRWGPDATLGSWFGDRVTMADTMVAVGSAVLIVAAVVIAGVPGLAVAGLGAGVLGAVAAAAIVAARGDLDGDGMGAIVELSAMGGLAAAAVVAI